MGFIDRAINTSFRDHAGERVVILNVKGGSRGYRVASAAEEAKLRAFLSMFLFAQTSIQLLGLFATFGWLDLRVAWGRAVRWSDLLAPAAEILIAYGVFVVLPLIFLWRAYRRSLASFVALDDEVPLSAVPLRGAARLWLAGALGLTILLGILIVLAVRHR
ncbi:MAG TPA: hypothetical protein VK800_00490 [Steroidobacteraceae bacterium]|jgi:hypothetical protein|nr:hypothetical protein [Steroidobacteraceae bacterium]